MSDEIQRKVRKVLEATEEQEFIIDPELVDWSRPTISTGSTLLDLCLTGGRTRYGGIPGGVIVEVFGPESTGKTCLLAEAASAVSAYGGEVRVSDPEARMDLSYARSFGLELSDDNYKQPDTVAELFEDIEDWNPKSDAEVHLYGADSLAALSTKIEMDSEDKRGQQRAKDFSAGLRKIARIIKQRNWILFCTNQIREGERGYVTPGGRAFPFYGTFRIQLGKPASGGKLVKKVKYKNSVVEKIYGIKTTICVIKDSLDDQFRKCDVYIIFGYGVDDIRGNLQYVKDMDSTNTFVCPDSQSFKSMKDAIIHIEENKLENDLKEEVVKIWRKIEIESKDKRKRKKR